jgi:hypothetical protein
MKPPRSPANAGSLIHFDIRFFILAKPKSLFRSKWPFLRPAAGLNPEPLYETTPKWHGFLED